MRSRIIAAGRERSSRLAENIVYFARALRAAGIPVGPGSVLDALDRGARGRRRHPRRLLLDAARGVREAPRPFGPVRPGVQDLLPQARLPRAVDGDDGRRKCPAPRHGAAAAGLAARAQDALFPAPTKQEREKDRSRGRRPFHRVGPRGAGEEGLRADDRGRDRRSQGRDQATGAALRRGEDPAARARSARPSHRYAPHACAPASRPAAR